MDWSIAPASKEQIAEMEKMAGKVQAGKRTKYSKFCYCYKCSNRATTCQYCYEQEDGRRGPLYGFQEHLDKSYDHPLNGFKTPTIGLYEAMKSAFAKYNKSLDDRQIKRQEKYVKLIIDVSDAIYDKISKCPNKTNLAIPIGIIMETMSPYRMRPIKQVFFNDGYINDITSNLQQRFPDSTVEILQEEVGRMNRAGDGWLMGLSVKVTLTSK